MVKSSSVPMRKCLSSRFIYITGCDGIGKTTQAKLLLSYLGKQGIHAHHVWLRFPFFLSIPLLIYARLWRYSWYEIEDKVRHGYWDFRRSWILRHVLPWTILVDAALAAVWNIYLPMILGITIVCERFVLDMLVDLFVAGAIANFDKNLPISLYLKLLPSRAHVFILTLEHIETLRQRRPDLRTDQKLEERLRAFERLAVSLNYPMISSQLPIENVFNQILIAVSEES